MQEEQQLKAQSQRLRAAPETRPSMSAVTSIPPTDTPTAVSLASRLEALLSSS